MSSPLKSVLFALVLCLVCSVLLTLASTGLKDIQEQNALVDQHRNILQAVGLVEPGVRYPAEEIERLYDTLIKPLRVGPDGQVLPEGAEADSALPLYLHVEDGEIRAYVVPVNSRGLWGRIHGYLAMESDGETVAGFSVFNHSETPGLGGEIESRWFQKNFVGKRIVNQEGRFVSVKIAKGAVEEVVPEPKRSHYVDGISGATMTGKYLSEGLEDILETYEPVSVRFRTHDSLRNYGVKR